MEVTTNIKYVGVNDHEIDLFEGQYEVPLGMAYNSYVIMDEKIAVMDTVGDGFGEEWMENIKEVLGERKPDYLIIQHMEPDHSSNIGTFMEEFPEAVIVSTKPSFNMMKQFYHADYSDKCIVAADGDTLSLGTHVLKFISAPMVHWPEVMFTYDTADKVLFSADAFGKFGANDVEDPEGWACEARRYYFGIVGKFGAQVQAVLKKTADLDIQTICPLHGPVLNEDISCYLNLYNIWSSYGVESEGILIAYTSVYGHTRAAALKLAGILEEKGCKVVTDDLARYDLHEAIEDAFRYGTVVLATTTYNGEIFPVMRTYIGALTERGYRNRRIGFIENGTWAPQAARCMKVMFENSKNIEFTEPVVTIRSSLDDSSGAQLEQLADALVKCKASSD